MVCKEFYGLLDYRYIYNVTICNKNFILFLKSSRQVQCSEEWMSRVISLTIIHFFRTYFSSCEEHGSCIFV